MNRLFFPLIVSIGTLLLLPVQILLMSTPPRVAAQQSSQPSAAQRQEMRRFSWAVPIQTFAQLAGLPSQSPMPNSQPLSGVMA